MRPVTGVALAAVLLAGVATNGISAVPKDYLAGFDRLMGDRLVSGNGATMLLTPSENQLTRETTSPGGASQKTLFTFLTVNMGTVASANDLAKAIGVFRITDSAIEIEYADGSTETLSPDDSGGLTSEVIAAGRDACIAWRPERLQLTAAFAPNASCPPHAAAKPSPEAQPGTTLLSPEVLRDMARIEAEIDRIEGETLTRLAEPPDNHIERVRLIGKALVYDRQLSVNRNEACAFCHMPEAGFSGPLSALNGSGAVYPGSLRDRFGLRKPPSQAYAAFSPVLHESPARGLVGGNFWDMRATGLRLGNPSAEQAEIPPTNPLEMGLPDSACTLYRASQRPYRTAFETVWGAQAFSIAWPTDVEQVCSRAGPAPSGDPQPVHLDPSDRGRAIAALDQMAQSIAAYEASPEVSSFTSKFDAVQKGKAQFSQQEQAGFDLFRGKAKCSACHEPAGAAPLFTNFTASNTGVPANRRLPFYVESQPDAAGFAANPAGHSFIDGGVGGFLAVSDSADLLKLAPGNQSRFRVPTLRNVDKRPDPAFIKAYGHNGYFKDLKTIVHFYNTRDTLRRCEPDDPGEGRTCWPAPESTDNMVTGVVGRLDLTDEEEDAIVSFLKTLSDGFSPPQ